MEKQAHVTSAEKQKHSSTPASGTASEIGGAFDETMFSASPLIANDLQSSASHLRRLSRKQQELALVQLNRLSGNHLATRLVQHFYKNNEVPEKNARVIEGPPGSRTLSPRTSSSPKQLMRYSITLVRSEDSLDPLTEAEITSIRTQLLEWRVAESELGNLSTLSRLRNNQIRQGMELIERLRTLSGLGGAPMRGNYPSRIIAAWNSHLDDLGPQDAYPTIVHFAVEMNRLTTESLHMNYLDAIQAMPTVRLAGAEIGVHPRAVYFTAAAQTEMDVAAGIEEGQGHYIAPGAFLRELRQIQRRLRQMARPPRRTRSGQVVGAEQQEVEAIGSQAFNLMRGQVLSMVTAMQAQEQGRSNAGTTAGEHREPGLRRYILPLAARLTGVPEAANADDARRLAGQMNTILGSIPVSQAAHGFGSIDPHGTDHAVGLAIDLFNGRGTSGGAENFGVDSAYWPFLHRLIDEHGSPGLRSQRPTAIHTLSPEHARELSNLLIEFGNPLAERMGQEAAEPATAVRQRRTVLSGYQQIAARIRSAYFQRWQILSQALNRTAWFRDAPPVRNQAAQVRDSLNVDRRGFMLQPPRTILSGLQEQNTSLENLYTQGDNAAQARSIEETERRTLQGDHRTIEFEDANAEDEEQITLLTNDVTQARERHDTRETTRLNAEIRRIRNRMRQRERSHRAAMAAMDRSRRSSEQQLGREMSFLERTRPSAGGEGRSLSSLQQNLSDSIDTYAENFQAQQTATIRGVVLTPKFRQWIGRVTNRDFPLYDQPSIVINAINNVIGHTRQAGTTRVSERTRFYGGHHWQVLQREAITNSARYQEILRLDMSQERRRPMIQRILAIMAESAGGRNILQGNDPEFTAALESVYGNATNMMSQAIGASGVNQPGASTPLQEFLRSRGFRYLSGDDT